MHDDSLPIMRILTALFFIKTDYVTALFDPNFLDCERSWILCIAALWNTLKPACTAPKHRSVNFLLPIHPHPDDIAHRRIALLKGFQRRLTDHPIEWNGKRSFAGWMPCSKSKPISRADVLYSAVSL